MEIFRLTIPELQKTMNFISEKEAFKMQLSYDLSIIK